MFKWAVACALTIATAGCASQSQEEIQAGRYHLNRDSSLQEINVSTIPDAVPRPSGGHVKAEAYTLNGVNYKPFKSATGYVSNGVASWYGVKFHGYHTANGEIYDMYAMTAAHKTLPLPSYAKVTNLENGRSVVVRVNDRGPFHGDRLIDLSWTAAKKLEYEGKGTARVKVEGIDTSPSGLMAFYRQNATKPTYLGTDADSMMYLQVAALKDRKKAESLKARLLVLLTQPVLVVPTRNASLFRVRIGPLKSEQELVAIQQSLEDYQIDRGQRVFD